MSVWVDEIEQPKPANLHTIDRLFNLIRGCSVMIVILFEDGFGTSIPASDHDETATRVHSSFWETELFYATLIDKPVEVFVVDGFRPEPKLAELLTLLKQALPPSQWRGPYSKARVAGEVRRVLFRYSVLPKWRSLSRVSAHLTSSLLLRRGSDMSGGHAEREEFQLMGGPYFDPTVSTNESVVGAILGSVDSGAHSDGSRMDEEGRLARLWLVFRELSGVSFKAPEHVDLLPYWNSLFGHWLTAGSWYGLHGHICLGVLPAAVAQAKIREKMRSVGQGGRHPWTPEATRYPGGAIASARYSIARKLRGGKQRNDVLRAALEDLKRESNEGFGDNPNHLLMTGSVKRLLGYPNEAVADYELAVQKAIDQKASADSLGVALSELGYGYLAQRRLRLGRDFLVEGVQVLSADPNVRSGFLIRAKRKLAIGYLLNRSPRLAWNEHIGARDLAKSAKAFDQF